MLTKKQSQWNSNGWPNINEYVNSETGKHYNPHNEEELHALQNKNIRRLLLKGGEGSGKSTFGVIKDLETLKTGASGILVSPDFEHFRRSIWPEFRRWCPWDCVAERHRYRRDIDRDPQGPFSIVFTSGATLYCGGMDEPMKWEGPNVHFAHFDEARRAKDAGALKVLDGRSRIVGPTGDPPQLWLTTTPRKNWLFEYFGPIIPNDPHEAFKRESLTITLKTRENLDNLDKNYITDRMAVLTSQESRVLLDAEWEDIEDADRFIPSMSLWDTQKISMPALTKHEPMVLAMDAGVTSDLFALVGTTRHWERHDECATRFVMKWEPKNNGEIDFDGTDDEPGPIKVLKMLRESYNIVMVTYDPYEMRYAASRLRKEAPVWLKPFGQQGLREEADKFLYDLIIQKRIWHDGDTDLREHISNADRKLTSEEKKIRLVKRTPGQKIDLAVALSMSAYFIMKLNV